MANNGKIHRTNRMIMVKELHGLRGGGSLMGSGLLRSIVANGTQQGDKIRSGYLTLPSRGPTSGWNCYVTPAFSGVPKQGDKIRSGYLTPAFSGAHKWAELLCKPCILGGPSKNSKVATSPLPSRGPKSGGQNQKWPTSGLGGYITPAVSRVPNASERGTKSEVAHPTVQDLMPNTELVCTILQM